MIRNATVVAVAFSALLLTNAGNATTISVSNDVLNGGNSLVTNLADGAGSPGAQVNLVHYIGTGLSSFTAIPYNQAGATIDVSAYVVPNGGARGAGQGIDLNSYPGVVAGSNLYLSGQDPTVNNLGFGAHANWLVTVDLNAVRVADFGGSPVSFLLSGTFGAFGGIEPGPASAGGHITGAIYLDGVQADVMQSSFSPVINPTFDVAVPGSAQYLTFTILNVPSILIPTYWNDGLYENVNLTSTPEPSTMMLLGLGAIGLFIARRRNK